ncbi:Asx homology domain-containing protein [Ampelomyces quisqualis]|uniref:Asx homology domain-containing protein n=1 Tax=Ampelomyces quisqualis TaxID=50730 RepID=A0A6A5QR22_AMPQU|nr:Asx homology domain-containing protein [Ampelomyces quisqualis]
MSLPVRKPERYSRVTLPIVSSFSLSPSCCNLSSPPDNQLHCTISTDKEVQTSPNQAAKLCQPPAQTEAMSQPLTDSSPLSTAPSTPAKCATPPSSSPPAQLSPVAPVVTGPSNSDQADMTVPATAAAPTAEDQSAASPTSNMSKKRAPKPTTKRDREDDNADGSPSPKKAATSRAKAKPARKKVAPKSTPRNPAAKTTAVNKVAPPAASSTRPSRNRKAPERFENFDEAKPPKELAMKGTSKVFDPVYITTNSTSRLGKADIYHMLLEPAAWSSLSTEQQATLVSMLPATPANTALLTRIGGSETEGTRPQAFSMSNDCFRTDVAKFKEDLKNGHLAKTWQAAAEQAVIERAAGEYDAWKAEEAESWWGQKSSAPR